MDPSLTVSYTNNVDPGTATASATYAGGTNFTGSTGSATFQIGYKFAGLLSPYAPPPTTFNVERTMPLSLQYIDASGTAINSSAANPQVTISMDSECSTTSASSTTDTITVSSSGASGYQYDSTTNTCQFNLDVKGNPAGCYAIYIKNGQTGQLNGPFLISVTSH